MSILSALAASMGRKDEAPNLELAARIAREKDSAAVQELFENLSHKNKAIQGDCIKVIYEIAVLEPKLVASYIAELVELLDSKNNRLQWGAMTALDAVTAANPGEVFRYLSRIVAASDKGSVITKDHCIGILVGLCKAGEHAAEAFDLLIEQLQTCFANQLPMYAENALPVVTSENKERFANVLASRLSDLKKESKQKRVEKVLKRMEKI